MNEPDSFSRTTADGGGRLYTLREIAAETGISLDDLARYRRHHGDRIPRVETEEPRRYPAEAVELFRSLHRRADASDGGRRQERGDEATGRRRLLSLSAQRRRQDEERRRQRERLAAEPVVDPGPPDLMTAALEALSGVVGEPRKEAKETGEPEEREEREEQDEREVTRSAVRTAGERAGPATPRPGEPEPAPAPPPAAQPQHRGDDGKAGGDDGRDGGGDEGPDRVIRRVVHREEPRPEPRAPKRPSRPVYTLHEIHERTGIPYARLALYAASHADQIPSVGERRSPAYMRAGLEAFCRLHALKEPGWEIPDLGPEPGWDDASGLAARMQALESAQQTAAEQLRTTLRALRRTWTGEAVWE